MRNPFARPKPRAKRKEPRRVIGRVRLYGEEKTAERRRIFDRSGGFCEAATIYPDRGQSAVVGMPIEIRCNRPITWETMHMSHKGHGPRRNDLETIASCAECHRNHHNAGGKPVPRKAGRKMNKKEAPTYHEGEVCFCGQHKHKRTSLCQPCKAKISPQLQFDLENATGDDWLTAMALAEKELLAWKPAEEQAR